MMYSNFITSNNVKVKKYFKNTRKAIIMLLSIMAIFVTGLLSLNLFQYSKSSSNDASSAGVVGTVMCAFGDDSIPYFIWNTTQTSSLQYQFRSKSAINNGTDNVDNGLNMILSFFDHDYKKINESIIGHPLDTITSSDQTYAKSLKYNGGEALNIFDRFGVAGLKFSSYAGEWKYFAVDACKSDSDPVDPKAGVYYEGRLEPKSTWEDIDNTKDVRTKQFSKSFFPVLSTSCSDVIANMVFFVTKFIVVLTIGLIDFAFSDISSLLGLTAMVGGDSSHTGIFTELFNGIFTPLIVIVFALTGCIIFWNAIRNRQYRNSLVSVLRSIGLFLIAVIISVAPSFFISLPNNVAVIVQSLMINALNQGISGGSGLCKTSVGSTNLSISSSNLLDIDKDQKLLAQASESMRSSIGCQYWQMLLFKPWVQGQWGTDYNNLWANNKIPSWADSGAKTLGNGNDSMVGDAYVPLGNGTGINNWAIFQISTQTNAHAPIGKEGEASKYTSGVANDWWRIVDAVSNYQEAPTSLTVKGTGSFGGSSDVSYTAPKMTKHSQYWDTWVGNNSQDRIWVSFSSQFIAIIALLAPLLFGFLSAVYGLGISILMAFSPIMFLLGCWPGKGWEMFKSWGEIVVNTTIKRIVTGVLLVLSVVFTSTALKMMDSIGWWQGILLLILLSLILWKGRTKIINSIASIRFAQNDLSDKANRIGAKTVSAFTTPIKASGRMTSSGVASGFASKRNGGSFIKGVGNGINNEIKAKLNSSNSTFAQSAIQQYNQILIENTGKDGEGEGEFFCENCHKRLDYVRQRVGILPGQKFLCAECLDDMVNPNAKEAYIDFGKIYAKKQQEKKQSANNKKNEETMDGSVSVSLLSSKNDYRKIENAIKYSSQMKIDDSKLNYLLLKLSSGIGKDINIVKNSTEIQEIQMPKMFEGIIPKNQLSAAWRSGNYDVIKSAYAKALLYWYKDRTGKDSKLNENEIFEEISKYE